MQDGAPPADTARACPSAWLVPLLVLPRVEGSPGPGPGSEPADGALGSPSPAHPPPPHFPNKRARGSAGGLRPAGTRARAASCRPVGHTLTHGHIETRARPAVPPSRAGRGAQPLYLLQEAENFLSATTTSASTTQVASRAAMTMAAMAPGPSEPAGDGGPRQPALPARSAPRSPPPRPAPLRHLPAPGSKCSRAVLSSGLGAAVGSGAPVAAGSRARLVLSTGPSPDGSSTGSFHRVGAGSCGPSAARPRTGAGARAAGPTRRPPRPCGRPPGQAALCAEWGRLGIRRH